MTKNTILTLLVATAAMWHASTAIAQGRTLTRLFWQDDSDATLRWADLKKNADGFHVAAGTVDGFPSLEPGEQSLVQMAHDDGILIVGVHDAADGSVGSGWVAVETGVTEEPHGDHSHWRFRSPPSIARAVVDDRQGNPAHVYQYDDSFVLANDKKNGFTITSAAQIRGATSVDDAALFWDGGNGHITLAVVDDRVAYATWIAPAGEHVGRVDVIGLGPNTGKRYAIHCPTGGLHGATSVADKVFFAPADGVCWVDADVELKNDAATATVHHLSLGTDPDGKPRRTGAFATMDSHVLFTTGKGDQSRLCLLDAATPTPTIIQVPLNPSIGQSVMSPIVVKTATGAPLACLFAESKDAPETDQMIVVALDPNRDGVCTDAVVRDVIAVGRNQMSAHAGHHDAVALPGGRQLAITNPGDQSIWILSMVDFSVLGKLQVGGTPTRLLTAGG